jgi:DNA-binding NarL/FixJ family response regulator
MIAADCEQKVLEIVVVEDNAALLAVTLNALRLPGNSVRGVESAEEFLAGINLQSVDVAVIDLNLGGRDGIWLAQQLREACPRVGIVMATARVSLQDRLAGYEMGADIYLLKPVEPGELVAAVQALGRRLSSAVSGQTTLQPLPAALPRRLREIAGLLLNTGCAIKDISSRLGLHEGTVRKHIERLYRAVGVNSRAELSNRFRG